MATEKQIEANRRNALKSCGPRTAEGKERSRRNALTHGLTAESLDVIPGEDRDAFEGRIGAWLRDLGARNEVEGAVIRRAAVQSWKLDRIDRHEVAVLTRQVRERAETDRARHRERVRAASARLLPTFVEVREGGFDPTPATDLVEVLESTAEGCDWLLEEWSLLRAAIRRELSWTTEQEMHLLRLLGERLEGIADPAALDLLVASRVYQSRTAKLDANDWEPGIFPMTFSREALHAACLRRPQRYEDACRILTDAVEKATARLKVVREIRRRDGDDWGAAESAALASFDTSAEGERLRRYQTTTHREMIRSLESVSKLRLQAQKLEKEEAASALRNEPNPAELAETVRADSPESPELRNEPNPPEAPQEDRTRERSAPESGEEVRTPKTSVTPRELLRNEPNFHLDGVEWIDLPPIGQGGDPTVTLRAAS